MQRSILTMTAFIMIIAFIMGAAGFRLLLLPRDIASPNKLPRLERANSSLAPATPGSAPTSVLIAMAKNYDYGSIHFFIESFMKWCGPNQRLVLFTDSQALCLGVRPDLVSCVEVSKIHAREIPHSNPAVRRFAYYDAWARDPEYAKAIGIDSVGMLFASDSRDVFFQGDIFTPMRSSGRGVHLFREYILLEDEPNYNQPWVRACVGQAALDRMIRGHAVIINSGVFGASDVESFLGFTEAMIAGLSQPDCQDQGYSSVLGWRNSSAYHIHHAKTESWVTHAPEDYDRQTGRLKPLENLFIDTNGRLCGPDKRAYALVHQADRFHDLWSLRHVQAAGGRETHNPIRFTKD